MQGISLHSLHQFKLIFAIEFPLGNYRNLLEFKLHPSHLIGRAHIREIKRHSPSGQTVTLRRDRIFNSTSFLLFLSSKIL